MGIAMSFGEAFYKSQACANQSLPREGTVFISVNDEDKQDIIGVAKKLRALGFGLVATKGTAKVLSADGIDVNVVAKHSAENQDLLKLIQGNKIQLILNTPSGQRSQSDMRAIRSAAVLHNIPCITTLQGALAAVNGLDERAQKEPTVYSLQELYKGR